MHQELKPNFFVLLDWLEENTLQRIVMVISEVDTDEVKERWQFDIQKETTGKTEDNKGATRFASTRRAINTN